jgi:photosystem II stability/assembly factor-like uncharacterized protein
MAITLNEEAAVANADGENWTKTICPMDNSSDRSLFALAYGEGVFVTGGAGGIVIYSTTGGKYWYSAGGISSIFSPQNF